MIMKKKKTKPATKRKWYTMTELRQLSDAELVEMAIELGGSEEWKNYKQRADLLAFIMGSQITMEESGVLFDKGGAK